MGVTLTNIAEYPKIFTTGRFFRRDCKSRAQWVTVHDNSEIININTKIIIAVRLVVLNLYILFMWVKTELQFMKIMITFKLKLL
jgi:hypothetical protein